MNVLITILLIVLDLFLKVFFSPSSFVLFSHDLMSIFSDMFGCFFFFMCVSIVDFWFAVLMWFFYNILDMNKIVLSCWCLNFTCISNILHWYSPLLTIAGFDIMLCVDDFLPLFCVCLYYWAS